MFFRGILPSGLPCGSNIALSADPGGLNPAVGEAAGRQKEHKKEAVGAKIASGDAQSTQKQQKYISTNESPERA